METRPGWSRNIADPLQTPVKTLRWIPRDDVAAIQGIMNASRGKDRTALSALHVDRENGGGVPEKRSGVRILMACAAFPPFIDGGGPISAMIVAKLLRAAGHDVEVVNVAGEDKHEIFDGVPVHRLRSLNIDWNYRLPRPAWKKLVWHALENFNPRAFFAMRREIR